MNKFRLNKEEIAREIHHLLRENYPGRQIDGVALTEFIMESVKDGTTLVFNAGDFCKRAGLRPEQTIKKLMYDLEVELEKNLHDKVLFSVKLTEDKIEFRQDIEK